MNGQMKALPFPIKPISNWEKNLAEPSVTIFYKVCRILGITNMYESKR